MPATPMTTHLAEGALVTLPLFVGFAAHGLCIKFGLLAWLTGPIDRGATVGGRRLFGDNKTFRGVVTVALGTALGFLLLNPGVVPLEAGRRPLALALLGLAVGAAAMTAELPNSFLKRRLDIPPGAQARGPRAVAFHVLDQIDVLAGAWLVLGRLIPPTLGRIIGSVVCAYVGHQLVTRLGFWLGMRRTAR